MQTHHSDPQPTIESCPNCEVDGTFRSWRETVADRGGSLRVLSEVHTIMGSEVSALVCRNCGYVQFFANPQDFIPKADKE